MLCIRMHMFVYLCWACAIFDLWWFLVEWERSNGCSWVLYSNWMRAIFYFWVWSIINVMWAPIDAMLCFLCTSSSVEIEFFGNTEQREKERKKLLKKKWYRISENIVWILLYTSIQCILLQIMRCSCSDLLATVVQFLFFFL